MEQRGQIVRFQDGANPRGEEFVNETKPIEIPKSLVVEAWKCVKANRGAGGVDGESLSTFEKDLENNLYKVWNRMSSGSYFPPPVKLTEIPKGDGKTRRLGVPTVADRVAQMVVKQVLEPKVEPGFHPDSYGYRPGRSAKDALARARERCFKMDWAIDMDIKGFFDNLRHDLVMRAVRHYTDQKWIHLYAERWLKAPLQLEDGTLEARDAGTPQGGVISPLLANMFMHYAFDSWMQRHFQSVPFERYADDVLIHCVSYAQAKFVLESVGKRLKACGLELHPEKTKIVYCKDGRRRKDFETTKFDFLGYTFQGRTARGKDGSLFVGFQPAMSDKAKQKIREEIRGWSLAKAWNCKTLEEIANMANPKVRGWINYYGEFYRSALYPILEYLNLKLVRWVMRKYKRFRRKWVRAYHWLGGISRRQPGLYAHWLLGIRPAAGR